MASASDLAENRVTGNCSAVFVLFYTAKGRMFDGRVVNRGASGRESPAGHTLNYSIINKIHSG